MMIKKPAALVAILLLFFITAGYHFLFRIQIAEAKSEMKAHLININKQDVTEFVFAGNQLSQLDWENDSEFSYNDEMYDVLEKATENGKTTIRCISDEKESSLVTAYQQIEKSNSEKNSSNIFLKLITTPFVPSSSIVLEKLSLISKPHFKNISSQAAAVYLDVLTPPPCIC